MKHLILLLLTFTFTACSVYIPPSYHESDASSWGQLPAGSTIKVIHANADNRYIAHLEDALARKGFTVIGSNTLVQSPVVADYRYQTADTTVFRTERRQMVTELFPAKPADYILRYYYISSSSQRDWLGDFGATVTNTNSGELEATFTYDRGTGNSRLFREMVGDMLTRWQ